jgi:hypothetical protein
LSNITSGFLPISNTGSFPPQSYNVRTHIFIGKRKDGSKKGVRAGEVAQVVKHQTSKPEALSSTTSTTPHTQKKEGEELPSAEVTLFVRIPRF